MQQSLYSPEQILAIVTGADSWPHMNLEDIPACANSAAAILSYLRSEKGMGLPWTNVLNLFSDPRRGPDQIIEIGTFLEEKQQEYNTAGIKITSVLFFFIGHGAFLRGTDQYYLVVKGTQRKFASQTCMQISSLGDCLREHASQIRRYIILDSCFSGTAATGLILSEHLQAAAISAKDSLPERGTALLCSSHGSRPSRAVAGHQFTMFTGSLLNVLTKGDKEFGPMLSLTDVNDAAWREMRGEYGDDAIRPVLYDSQEKGSLARVLIFPNPAVTVDTDPVLPVSEPSPAALNTTPGPPELSYEAAVNATKQLAPNDEHLKISDKNVLLLPSAVPTTMLPSFQRTWSVPLLFLQISVTVSVLVFITGIITISSTIFSNTDLLLLSAIYPFIASVLVAMFWWMIDASISSLRKSFLSASFCSVLNLLGVFLLTFFAEGYRVIVFMSGGNAILSLLILSIAQIIVPTIIFIIDKYFVQRV